MSERRIRRYLDEGPVRADACVEPGRTMTPERLWRVRKDHRTVEAILRHHPGGVEVLFYYKRAFIYARRWPTRAAAADAAQEKLNELLRHGWATHW